MAGHCLAFVLLLFSTSAICQTIDIKDHLLLHVPFDGDNNKSIKVHNYSGKDYRFTPQTNNQIKNEHRIYKQNDVLKMSRRRADSILLKAVNHFPLSILFWVRIQKTPITKDTIELFTMTIGDFKLHFREERSGNNSKSLFALKITDSDEAVRETQLELDMNTINWQLLMIQIDETGLLKFSFSNSIIDKDLNRIANPLVHYSAPGLNVSDALKPNSTFDCSVFFSRKKAGYDISIDDIRVYDKVLSKEELGAIARNDPYKHIYIGKYQLAYTYKQIADQFYLTASDINRTSTLDPTLIDSSRRYYEKARDALLIWVNKNTSEEKLLYEKLVAFQFNSLKEMNELDVLLDTSENKIRKSLPIANYYDLLLFDINYRLRLLNSHYSYWGKDLTEKPLFPVQEYQFFSDAFAKFNTSYLKIESLLKTQEDMDEKQEVNELQSQLAQHKSEIEKVRIDETQYKADFYSRQSSNVKSRMSGIEQQQKDLNREVERKEQKLKELDAKIMGQLSGAISQATLGVSIDVTRDLGAQLKTAGIQYLGGNSELASSLLGSYKDVYDVTVTAREYYQKGKEALSTIKSIAEGNISADNIFKMGDAVANSGFIDEQWSRKWTKMKDTYKDINERYEQGKALIQKIEMTAKNPNLKNIVGFVDWMATTTFVPENYRKDFQQFKNFREAAYTAIKDKRYDDLVKLGEHLFNEAGLEAEVTRIRGIVQDLKPAMIIFEMIKDPTFNSIKDKLLSALNDGTLDAYMDPKIQQEFLVKTIIKYLHNPQLSPDNIEPVFQDLLNQAPEAILECFPFRVQEDLFKVFKVNSYAQLVTQMRNFKLTDLPKLVRVHHDTLFVFEEPYTIEISKYLTIDKASLKTFIQIIKKYPSLLSELKNSTNPMELAKLFEKTLIEGPQAASKVKEAYNLINSMLSGTEQKIVEDQAVKFYMGNGVFQASVNKDDPNSLYDKIPPLVDPENPTEVVGENMGQLPAPEKGDNSEMMRQLAAKALDMAFPGVGTAVSTLLGIADAIFGGYQIVDELRAIYKEKVDLNKEYVLLMDNLRENEFNQQIALYETRISNISYAITLEEHVGYSKLVNSIIDRKKDVRRRIGGHLPMLFFYAERLRYYYQRLNKSSTFWYGSGNSLNKIIFADQNNLRLAIDPDIKLFDWVTSPDVTSSREDIFRLFSYWARINSLVTDGLISNRLKYGENLTEISYQVLDLKELDQKQWKDFERWQKNPNTHFNYTLDMTGGLSFSNLFGFDSSFTSIKCLQVIPIAIGSNSKRIHNLVTISNLGISTNEVGVVEPLAQKSRSSADEQLEFDSQNNLVVPANYLTRLRSRWNNAASDYQPYNFEGYNLRSNWKFSIKPSGQSPAIQKILFVVFYQYTKDYNRLQSGFDVEYLYKVKLKYNPVSPNPEYLNVALPADPGRVANAGQYESLLHKYPNLKDRVQPADLTPYFDQNNPIIVNKASLDDIRFSKMIEQPKRKKYCFISKLFKRNK